MRSKVSVASSITACADDWEESSTCGVPPASATISETVAATDIAVEISMPAHEKYFFKGGLTTFSVENKSFRVHDHILTRESDELRTSINALHPQSTVALKGVTAFEFETLLCFLCEGMYDDFSLSLDQWIAVLSIATRYGMHKVHKRAVREIANHSNAVGDVRKIVLAKKYNVDEWLAPAHTALCLRQEPLTVSEAEQLGLETAVKLARAREELQRSRILPIITVTPGFLPVPSGPIIGTSKPSVFRTSPPTAQLEAPQPASSGSTVGTSKLFPVGTGSPLHVGVSPAPASGTSQLASPAPHHGFWTSPPSASGTSPAPAFGASPAPAPGVSAASKSASGASVASPFKFEAGPVPFFGPAHSPEAANSPPENQLSETGRASAIVSKIFGLKP